MVQLCFTTLFGQYGIYAILKPLVLYCVNPAPGVTYTYHLTKDAQTHFIDKSSFHFR